MSDKHDISRWQHSHAFDSGNPAAERNTRVVLWLTLLVMVAEISGGWWLNSMALLADGWHMASDALSIGLASFAYRTARKYANDGRFSFGTWKMEILAGYTSALSLIVVALLMLGESVLRLMNPEIIHYREAIAITVLGLCANLAGAWILIRTGQGHDHGHAHAHDQHGHAHQAHHGAGEHADLNLRAAYIHVLADAATSMLAIVALVCGMWLGWSWLDAVAGIVGSVLIGGWAIGLLRSSSRILLDGEMDHPLVQSIHKVLTNLEPADALGEGLHITDLHLWRVGRNRFACMLTLATHRLDLSVEDVHATLAAFPEIAHLTVELHRCAQEKQA